MSGEFEDLKNRIVELRRKIFRIDSRIRVLQEERNDLLCKVIELNRELKTKYSRVIAAIEDKIIVCKITPDFKCEIEEAIPGGLEDFTILEEFVKHMVEKIVEGKTKHGDFRQYSVVRFRKRLIDEFIEWKDSIGSSDEPNELVDIANICFFLWSKLKDENVKKYKSHVKKKYFGDADG